MKTKTLLFLLITFLSTNLFSQKTQYLSQAVNLAGKQRMLGQRMAKDKLYMEANTKSKAAEKEMEAAIAAFEYGVKYLKTFAPTKTIRYKVDVQEFAFNTYRELITATTKKSMKQVVECNTLFLAICDDVVTGLIDYSKTRPNNDKNKNYVLQNIAKATGASGKLRYLTQRLTLYYALNSFDVKKVTPEQIHTIVQTMERNLNYLTVLEFNTLEIDDSLSEVLYYWNKLKSVIYKDGKVVMKSKKISIEELYDLCNTVLAKANATTKMYADLNKS
ncbi:type IV pili methyl-accepting chemotaxis transducer N-terminal domain-containing protein [Wenyingzhuangia sp. IMCC45533]